MYYQSELLLLRLYNVKNRTEKSNNNKKEELPLFGGNGIFFLWSVKHVLRLYLNPGCNIVNSLYVTLHIRVENPRISSRVSDFLKKNQIIILLSKSKRSDGKNFVKPYPFTYPRPHTAGTKLRPEVVNLDNRNPFNDVSRHGTKEVESLPLLLSWK